jgi:hypothetical protein
MNLALTLIVWMSVKHFIVDFPMQCSWMYKNKGTLFHMGGVVHALLHGIGTALVIGLIGFGFKTIIMAACIDIVIHYFVDYAKININRKLKWTPVNTEYFWWLLGYDQLLHMLTYVYIISLVVKVPL